MHLSVISGSSNVQFVKVCVYKPKRTDNIHNNNNNKYKILCIEIQRMWNLKCTIVPVIIGATGIVTRSLKKNLETIPGKHSIDSLQRQLYLEHHT